MNTRKAYSTDLSEREWERLQPLLPPPKRTGRPLKYPVRELLNAIVYVTRTGCAWRLLPHDLPQWMTVYAYFRRLSRDGSWIRINDALRGQERQRQGHEVEPATLIIDSQSVKTTEKGAEGR